MKFKMILAADSKGGIGKGGTLPWRLPSDLKFFQRTTIGNRNNCIFMGRKTWESIPEKFRPLKNRTNFVLSRTLKDENCHVIGSMDELKEKLKSFEFEEVWCIGGATLYKELIQSTSEIILTDVDGDFECDTRIDELLNKIEKDFDEDYDFSSEKQVENDIKFQFRKFIRKN